jgi:hypothetical protein
MGSAYSIKSENLKEKKTRLDWSIILKWVINEVCAGVNWVQDPMTGFCEHGNEASGSLKRLGREDEDSALLNAGILTTTSLAKYNKLSVHAA